MDKSGNPKHYAPVAGLARGQRSVRIITIGGGKGGIGKTMVSASLAIALAEAGARVVLFDADLGGANIHTVMGLYIPDKTLHDFITHKVKLLSEVVINSPIDGLKVICGAPGSVGFANLEYWEKMKIIRHLRRLFAEFVVVDIGAGTSFNEIDIFNAGDVQIVVANPEPTSIQECYNFLKVAIFRHLRREFADSPEVLQLLDRSRDPTHVNDHRLLTEIGNPVRQQNLRDGVRLFRIVNNYSPKLILNRVFDFREIREGLALQVASQELLRMRLEFWGYLSYDARIAKAVRAMRPGEILPSDSENRMRFQKMVRQYLLGENVRYRSVGHRTIFPLIDAKKDLQENTRICSLGCPLWGNCELQKGGLPCGMSDSAYYERVGSHTSAQHGQVATKEN